MVAFVNLRRLLLGTLAACLLVLPVTPAFAARSSVDAYLDAWQRSNGVPGVAVAVLDGEETSTWLIGRDGRGRPMTSNTPLLVGSVAKTMTSTMVLQLVDEARVALDDSAQAHLPWLGHRATVRQLLTHTAGYSAADGLAVSECHRPELTVTAAARELEHTGVIGDYRYSSANYLVLGALIERLTGNPFASELRTRITERAGMTGTDASGPSAAASPGHRLWWGHPWAHDPGPEPSGAPYGYVVSTLDDLVTYARAQLGGELTSTASRSAAWSEQAGPESGYGYGWRIDTGDGSRRVHHSGATPGHFAHLMLMPDRNRAVVVLANAYSEARAPSLAAAAADIDRLHQGRDASPTTGDAMLTGLPWLTLTPAALAVAAIVVLLRRRPKTGGVTLVLIGASVLIAGLLAFAPMLLGTTWHVVGTWTPDAALGLIAGIAGWLAVVLLLALPGRRRRPQADI